MGFLQSLLLLVGAAVAIESAASAETKAVSRPLRVGVHSGLPEATGVTLALDLNSYVSLSGSYSWPVMVDLQVGVASKTLVSQDGFSIRSPDLNLPFAIDFGPQSSLDLEWHPFGGSFYLSGGLAERTVKIHSHLESALLFTDGTETVASHTEFAADLRTQTQQELARTALGQRWKSAHVYWGWSAGLLRPLNARSTIDNRVDIINPLASDSSDSAAKNLEDARLAQQQLLRDKAASELHRLESQALPLLNIEIGLRF